MSEQLMAFAMQAAWGPNELTHYGPVMPYGDIDLG